MNRNVPIAVSMAGGYANDIDDIVDIHFATIKSGLRVLADAKAE